MTRDLSRETSPPHVGRSPPSEPPIPSSAPPIPSSAPPIPSSAQQTVPLRAHQQRLADFQQRDLADFQDASKLQLSVTTTTTATDNEVKLFEDPHSEPDSGLHSGPSTSEHSDIVSELKPSELTTVNNNNSNDDQGLLVSVSDEEEEEKEFRETDLSEPRLVYTLSVLTIVPIVQEVVTCISYSKLLYKMGNFFLDT